MLPFLTLDQADVDQTVVFVRADLNLPIHEGQTLDLTRAERLLPTLNLLAEKRAKIIIASHRGRPKGKSDPHLSMHPLYQLLKDMWTPNIHWVNACVGPAVQQAIKALHPGEALVLENLRFHEEEEQNDPHFARQLADLADCYVNDAFACSHRAHASIVGITEYLPSFAGQGLKQEWKTLHQAFESQKRPLMVIIGGAKVSTKLALLKNLAQKADILVLGGSMATTFLGARGHPVGQSLVELDLYPQASEIMAMASAHNCTLVLPEDVVVIEPFGICTPDEVQSHHTIMDIGPTTVSRIAEHIKSSKAVIWNGPLGVFETPPFHQGSCAIAKEISTQTRQGLLSIAGGGDTLATIKQADDCDFSYLSTAGGAFLEWLAGLPLPGLIALSEAKWRQIS